MSKAINISSEIKWNKIKFRLNETLMQKFKKGK